MTLLNTAANVLAGSTPAVAVYAGDVKVWPPAVPISFVKSISGSGISGGTTSVTFTGHQKGDLLLAMGGNRVNTPFAVPAGWTLAKAVGFTGNQQRAITTCWKIAESADPVTIQFTGGGGGDSTTPYSGGMVFRGARGIGATASHSGSGAGVNTLNFAGLTPQVANGSSCMVVTTYLAAPDGFTGAPAGWTMSGGFLYRLAQSAMAAGTGPCNNVFNVTVSLELLD